MTALFISHSHADGDAAERLRAALETAGYRRVFLSSSERHGIDPGAHWEPALLEKLAGADALIALVTPASNESRWCFAETTHAKALGRPIFPVALGGTEIPTHLQGVQAAALGEDFTGGMEALLRGLEAAGLRPRGRSPRRASALRRSVLVVALVAAALGLALHWHLGRDGYLTVSAVPAALLFLDGVEVGTTPVSSLAISPGTHELRLERPRFHPFLRRFEVGRGSTYELERGLQALDPADPAALADTAAALGVPLARVSLERSAQGSDPVVLFPRGALRRPPDSVRLWTRAGGPDYTVVLEALSGDAATVRWQGEAPSAEGKRSVELPGEVRALFVPGTRWRVRVSVPGAPPVAASEVRVLDDAEQVSVASRLAPLARVFPDGDPVAEILRAEILLDAGLHEEAYERTVTLAEAVGARREISRLALAILDRAGLRGQGWWASWEQLHADAN